MKTINRRHPLVLGTVAAVVALVAAAGAAVAVGALTDDEAPERPVDASLRITPEDQAGEEDANPLVAGDPSGDPAPTATFPRLEGGLGSLADYAGTPVVLNFWASSCVPCKKEMPDLQQVHEELGDRVAFLGLAVNDPQRSAEAFVEEHGATYDMGRDPSGKLFSDLGAVLLPSTFFISADGVVVGARPGALEADVLRKLIDEHLLR